MAFGREACATGGVSPSVAHAAFVRDRIWEKCVRE